MLQLTASLTGHPITNGPLMTQQTVLHLVFIARQWATDPFALQEIIITTPGDARPYEANMPLSGIHEIQQQIKDPNTVLMGHGANTRL